MTGFSIKCNIELKRVKPCPNSNEVMSKGVLKTLSKISVIHVRHGSKCVSK